MKMEEGKVKAKTLRKWRSSRKIIKRSREPVSHEQWSRAVFTKAHKSYKAQPVNAV
jgi:hypothetical protein